jgi:murein DD-endopeptidase MepM/ murein hydrolase activator NlpD
MRANLHLAREEAIKKSDVNSQGMKKFKYKYIFNPNTLNYEAITYTIRDYTWIVTRYVLAGVVLGGIGIVLYASFFKDPETEQLEKKINYLETKIETFNRKIDTLELFATDLERRDENVYRSIFGAEPYARKYSGLSSKTNNDFSTDKDVEETLFRIRKLQEMFVSQSKSYEEIYSLARGQDAMLQSIPAIQPVSNKDLERISSGFGYRIHPIYKVAKLHTGLDFTADIGTEIYATGDGVVEKIESIYTGYGNNAVIQHGYGYQTLYAHMSKILVRHGEKVRRGQLIGLVGNTGASTGPHLHYEVIRNGEKVDPAFYFYNDITPEQYEEVLQRAANANQSFD